MIRFYYMDVSCGCTNEEVQFFLKILPEEKIERLNRLRNQEIMHKQMIAGAFLQCVLSRELRLPVDQIRYQYGEHGKPRLCDVLMNVLKEGNREDEEHILCHFNLSHSGDYVVAAVSDELVGIDVERVHNNNLSVAERFFCRQEYEDILAAGDAYARQIRFTRYWTMKEAYIKRSGEGLKMPLNCFCILRGENDISRVKGENVYFFTHKLSEEYYVSICSIIETDLEELKKPFQIKIDDIYDVFSI